MTTVIAEFDGKVFIPQGPVELAPGTKITIAIPVTDLSPPKPPRPPTEEERCEWQRFIDELNKTEPYFPTVEAALGYSRKYPGYYP